MRNTGRFTNVFALTTLSGIMAPYCLPCNLHGVIDVILRAIHRAVFHSMMTPPRPSMIECMVSRAVAWPKYVGGGGCLLSKYQVAIPVLILGIINFLKTQKLEIPGGGSCPPCPPPPQATALVVFFFTLW